MRSHVTQLLRFKRTGRDQVPDRSAAAIEVRRGCVDRKPFPRFVVQYLAGTKFAQQIFAQRSDIWMSQLTGRRVHRPNLIFSGLAILINRIHPGRTARDGV